MTIRPVCFAIALALGACGNNATTPTSTDGSGAPSAATDAERVAKEAQKTAREASDKITQLSSAYADLNKRMDKALDDTVSAKSDAERAAAKDALDSLRKQKADLDVQLAAARDDAARAIRQAGVHISKACTENPLAPGC